MLAAATLAPTPALAHAALIETTPAEGSVVAQPPAEIVLVFSEPVRAIPGGVSMIGPDGEAVPTSFEARGNRLVVTPEGLDTGTHIVDWRTTSDDGHVVGGALIFSVGEVTDLEAAPAEQGAAVLRPLLHIATYAASMLAVGLALFGVHVHDGGREWRLIVRTVHASAALAVGCLALSLLATSSAAMGAVSLAMVPEGGWLALGSAAAGGAGLGVGVRRRNRPITGSAAAALIVAHVLIGHTRTFGPTWVVAAADAMHVLAGSFWVGGLIGLATVMTTRRGYLSGTQPLSAAVTPMISRFSRLALVAVVAIVTSGVILGWRYLETPAALVETTFGQLVLVKVALVGMAVVIAAASRFALIPRIPSPAGLKVARRLRAATLLEVVLIGAVLCTTGFLVEQNPRASDPPEALVPVHVALGEFAMSVEISPSTEGQQRLTISIRDEAGPLMVPTVISAVHADAGPFRHTFDTPPDGEPIPLPLPGTWTLSVSARVTAFEEATATLLVDTDGPTISTSGIWVTNPMLPQPLEGAPSAVMYLDMASDRDDAIVAASSWMCEEVTLHESVQYENGRVVMERRERIPVPGGGITRLASGEYHAMCEDPRDVPPPGEQGILRLTMASGETIAVAVDIVTYAEIARTFDE